MQQDPLSHAPRPGKLVTDINTQETPERKKDSSKAQIYKAPKLSATVMEVSIRRKLKLTEYTLLGR